ncbi:MAG TPA: acyl-CoA ligase (AMP-forming), exosortase A system-associated, partial [Candidatus Tenderia electrophaga]|nr:acyl-CoA ligase (AMP-forming), exosortase A system-associated [Candidatus Tenderia electrophaga]
DCNARILITSKTRLPVLAAELNNCHDLHSLVLLEDDIDNTTMPGLTCLTWRNFLTQEAHHPSYPVIDMDMAAILYTSGSTGKPKGVVLSHRNMVTGAHSVAEYLENRAEDNLLAVLPFSFDYGFSQLTTAFSVGASVVLMDYLLPRDVINAIAKYQITGLAAVPPLWNQLSTLSWPEEAQTSLRYITNSGGAMPLHTLSELQAALPQTQPYLMYGLTEAFRSTYLAPEQLQHRPESMGKAIPNAEVMVVHEDGSSCAPGETGELVHRGSLVAMGYWNDPEKTAERFRPTPGQSAGLPLPEMAVWSGDQVKMDEEGYLYFVGRKDEMIKTSGYRVSPTEVEEILYRSGLVSEAVALGVPHPMLGQAIVAVISPQNMDDFDLNQLRQTCVKQLPNFMMPAEFITQQTLPRNPNGKVNRRLLSDELSDLFQEAST